MLRRQITTVLAFTVALIFSAPMASAQITDCNTNGIPDECDIDCGSSGGPCDLPGCGQGQDCNTTGVPDECEAGNEGAGFDDPASWATFDAQSSTNGVGATGGYQGAVLAGQYVYFVPYQRTGEAGGEILRYHTTEGFCDPGSWETFDATAPPLGANGGYLGGAFDGQYVYFAPMSAGGGAYHCEVLRYNTEADFDEASSWEVFDAQTAGVSTRCGYYGAVFDGRRVHFVPNYNAAHAEVLSYDTTGDFSEPTSWDAFDVQAAGIGSGPYWGWFGGVYDGERYVYFAPNDHGPGYLQHGDVLRFDGWEEFSDPSSWRMYDYGDSQECADDPECVDPDDYRGAAFDGRYVYFAPARKGSDAHGEVLRYDTEGDFDAPGSWATHDYSESQDCLDDPGCHDPEGFNGAVFDGRYVYFVPEINGPGGEYAHNEVLRFDTTGEFRDPASWDTFDYGDHCGTSGICPDCNDPDGYAGAVFDSVYLYFAPAYNGTKDHGEVLRYDTTAGWSPDCNSNGIPDECDIAEGTSNDCNVNNIPDECEPDIDGDGVLYPHDVCPCTISPGGVTQDGRPLGDLDEDCDVDLKDYAIFAVNHEAGGPRS